MKHFPTLTQGARLAALCCGLGMAAASAKPIAYANGWSLMGEYGAGTMTEGQLFYAPTHWLSLGGGYIELEDEDKRFDRHISYARANVLIKRWNLPRAQGNLFAWGGAGRTTGSDFHGATSSANTGFQADYETRRVYTSLRSDLHYSRHFSHRIDTLQLGWAPYAHDYESMATWLLFQVRDYTGDLYSGLEPALLVRLFKGPAWIEAGATIDGHLQAMVMFNF
ncbi:MAG: hypothetical protein ACREUE_04545 [Panacagrimonas sp.]